MQCDNVMIVTSSCAAHPVPVACSVGHFRGAVDPGTRTFGDFATWVEDNAEELRDKTVMMYCTGGIRCEKASAFAREQGIKSVYQLAGGIHRCVARRRNEQLPPAVTPTRAAV